MELRTRTYVLLLSIIVTVKAGIGYDCSSPKERASVQTTSPDGRTVTFDLKRESFVSSISILTCATDRALADGQFTIKYVDPTDFTYQERIYSEEAVGVFLDNGRHFSIALDPNLYATRLSFSHQHAISCSQIQLFGCGHHEVCHSHYSHICKNGGTCVGNGQCECTRGYMGPTCESSIKNMTFDDFGFVADVSGTLYTNGAVFSVSGNVSFSYDDVGGQVSSRRNLRSHGHSHGFAHFSGHGGSLNLLPSLITGFQHANGALGHFASHSVYSALHNFAKGFSHSVQAIFGHGHHHRNTHYFYTTHGTSHYSHGSSLHYLNNLLHMHIHYTKNNGHHHHYHLSAAFTPKPGVKYTIVSSFSPHFGASLYINGHKLASLTLPNIIRNAVNNFGIPKPLCFGLCGAHIGNGPVQLAIGNIGVAGANVATLAKNALLGLLGLPMLNLLGSSPTTTVASHLTQSTTQPTTVRPGRFTPAPTTLPPATATTAHLNTKGPVCYECAQTTGSCSTTSQCFPGEVCSVFSSSQGNTHRCMSKQLCTAMKQTAVGCWKCCTSDFCNDRCGSAPTCQDQPRCSLLRAIGYKVCNDLVASISLCPKSCNKCPGVG